MIDPCRISNVICTVRNNRTLQILCLPRERIFMRDLHQTWNVIYNARSIRNHHQVLLCLARRLAVQNLPVICRKQLKRHLQCAACAADPRRSETVPTMNPTRSPSVHNPPRNRRYFSGSPRAFRAPAIVAIFFTPYFRKVTLELHQIVRLPWKITLEHHQNEKWHFNFTKSCTCYKEWHLNTWTFLTILKLLHYLTLLLLGSIITWTPLLFDSTITSCCYYLILLIFGSTTKALLNFTIAWLYYNLPLLWLDSTMIWLYYDLFLLWLDPTFIWLCYYMTLLLHHSTIAWLWYDWTLLLHTLLLDFAMTCQYYYLILLSFDSTLAWLYYDLTLLELAPTMTWLY